MNILLRVRWTGAIDSIMVARVFGAISGAYGFRIETISRVTVSMGIFRKCLGRLILARTGRRSPMGALLPSATAVFGASISRRSVKISASLEHSRASHSADKTSRLIGRGGVGNSRKTYASGRSTPRADTEAAAP